MTQRVCSLNLFRLFRMEINDYTQHQNKNVPTNDLIVGILRIYEHATPSLFWTKDES